ncbi:MAG: hypothetical protein ACXVB4_09475 [Pseudobdellovibrionaceae bacterium]
MSKNKKMKTKKFSAALLSAFAAANVNHTALAAGDLSPNQKLKLLCTGKIKLSEALNDLSVEEYNSLKNQTCKSLGYNPSNSAECGGYGEPSCDHGYGSHGYTLDPAGCGGYGEPRCDHDDGYGSNSY